MRRQIVVGVVFGLLFAAVGFAAPTEIIYKASKVGEGRCQYEYSVENKDLSMPIEEFTIWFDFAKYDNLAVETAEPLASEWDEVVWPPEPVLADDGAYDAMALTVGIQQGKRVDGFAVSFDWLGEGGPGSQFYQIVHPETFETIDEGWTIPEPATLFLFGLGLLALRKKNRPQISPR